MRDNFERGLYEGEEYQYWHKASAPKEKLALLERVPEPAINRAAQTLLDLRETWEDTTQEERRDSVYVMIQEVGVEMAAKCILWVKARPDYEPVPCKNSIRQKWGMKKSLSTFQGFEYDLTKLEFRNGILKKCMCFG